ncbi:MAG: hypothetical protein M0006_15055 [Magnetospirillum sp.]|nr:hypothetical protein [Magnetospirillum sp.]
MDITIILQILAAAAQLLPEIEQVLPVVAKIIDGQTATETDAAAVYAAIQALEAQVAGREAAAAAT